MWPTNIILLQASRSTTSSPVGKENVVELCCRDEPEDCSFRLAVALLNRSAADIDILFRSTWVTDVFLEEFGGVDNHTSHFTTTFPTRSIGSNFSIGSSFENVV